MTSPRAVVAQPGEVDLHMHSTASDGSLPPEEVVAAAKAVGVAAIALTDHDTLDGIPEATRAAEAAGIRVVAGVELSAHDGAKEIHILALHVSNPGPLELRLSMFRDARQTRAQLIVDKLGRIGAPVTFESVMTEAAGGAVGRPHIARAMIKAGHVKDSRDAFDRYLGAGKAAFVEKERLEIQEAIEITHAAGAIAIWAHPGPDGRRDRLEPLVALGLDGVEVKHPSHNSDDVERLSALADFFGILYSGGSDWHGVPGGYRSIGGMHVPGTWLDKQDEVVNRRRAAAVA
ncbi:MAG TPA: PHP domain-containing protein [Gemmatimonadaceae bacterium]|nr:PHP domain-containing protein [Gemmatimonadaceae bacterium]